MLMGLIFDTHAHYDDTAYDEDRDALLCEMLGSTVYAVVNQGTDIRSSEYSIALAEKYSNIYAAVGLHPEYLHSGSLGDVDSIRKLSAHPKAVAIGEIGLDYHCDIPRDLQKTVFSSMLELAKELRMPVNIHDREAHGDTMEMLRRYRPKGILHCFSGSTEMAREVVKLGMYIGIGGVVTFKNARKTVETVRDIPLSSIVLETDCPYLSPEPFRGKRNDSGNITYTAGRIAEIKGISTEEVLKITKENGENVYGLNKR